MLVTLNLKYHRRIGKGFRDKAFPWLGLVIDAILPTVFYVYIFSVFFFLKWLFQNEFLHTHLDLNKKGTKLGQNCKGQAK